MSARTWKRVIMRVNPPSLPQCAQPFVALRYALLFAAVFMALSGAARATPAPAAPTSSASPDAAPMASPSPAASTATPPPPAEQVIGLHPILGVQIDTQAQTRGLLVDAVLPKSIAARMALEPGDILLELNGVPLLSMETLHAQLSRLVRGHRLEVKYRHGSEMRKKTDDLRDVPQLATYEIVEGKGLPGVLEIGYTRDQVVASLGQPLGEKQGEGVVYLAYPFHGITVALIEGGGQMRVMQFSVEYPLVCRTSRGLVTGATRGALDAAYKGDAIDTRVTESGMTIDTIPSLGIQFRSLDGRIGRVSVIPRSAAASSTKSP